MTVVLQLAIGQPDGFLQVAYGLIPLLQKVVCAAKSLVQVRDDGLEIVWQSLGIRQHRAEQVYYFLVLVVIQIRPRQLVYRMRHSPLHVLWCVRQECFQ